MNFYRITSSLYLLIVSFLLGINVLFSILISDTRNPSSCLHVRYYVGVLRSLWLFLFPNIPVRSRIKKKFLDWLTELEQRIHNCVEL
jgi:hypothetical protein